MPAKKNTRKPAAAPKKKPAATAAATKKSGKPAANPEVTALKRQLTATKKKLDAASLDLVTKVALSNEKKSLERRIADLNGDKPFLAKVPKHKQAA